MADAINTGTMLIEEDTFLPESLRFESEPWTSFYKAGEIIRESRKSSASSACPPALLDATRYSRMGGRLHLVGSLFFNGSSSENPAVRVVPEALPAAVAATV